MTNPTIAALIIENERLRAALRAEIAKFAAAFGLANAESK